MKQGLLTLGFLGFILAAIGIPIWWEWYKFQECLKVGHAAFYCIFAN